MGPAFHMLQATLHRLEATRASLVSSDLGSGLGLPMRDLRPVRAQVRAQAVAALPPGPMATQPVARTPGLLAREILMEASIVNENNMLCSQLCNARLARENALLRWQLQQHQNWQDVRMHERRHVDFEDIGRDQHLRHQQDLPRGFTAPPGLPPPPGLKTPPCLMRCDSDPASLVDDISTMAPEGMLSRGVSEDGYDSEHSETKSIVTKTTCMLRNLPNIYTRDTLLLLLDNSGFAGKYNFLYVPMDFNTDDNLGYAFVNMVTPEDAMELQTYFQGFSNWALAGNTKTSVGCNKVCEVGWSDALQGLNAHVERYRNSPVMHDSVPDSFKPLLFSNGQRVPFPVPTKKIRAPRRWVRKH